MIIHALKLILPVLIPSWDFFDVIVASPRIQFSLVDNEAAEGVVWQEYRPRPATLSLGVMLRRMFWNAPWNESLYMVSCAERLIDYPTKHSEDEIFRRLIKEVIVKETNVENKSLRFRLVFIKRTGEQLVEEICFQSGIKPIIEKDFS